MQQLALSPCGSHLLDALRRARLAWARGATFAVREVFESSDAPPVAAPTSKQMLPAYAEDPDVALLIRRCIEVGIPEPRLG